MWIQANELISLVSFLQLVFVARENCEARELLVSRWHPTGSLNEMIVDYLLVHLRRYLIHVRVVSRMVTFVVFEFRSLDISSPLLFLSSSAELRRVLLRIVHQWLAEELKMAVVEVRNEVSIVSTCVLDIYFADLAE